MLHIYYLFTIIYLISAKERRTVEKARAKKKKEIKYRTKNLIYIFKLYRCSGILFKLSVVKILDAIIIYGFISGVSFQYIFKFLIKITKIVFFLVAVF